MYYNLVESSEINDIFLIKPTTVAKKTSRIWGGLWVFQNFFLHWIYSIYFEHTKTNNIERYNRNANNILRQYSIRFLYIEQLMSRLKEKFLGLSAVEKYLTDREGVNSVVPTVWLQTKKMWEYCTTLFDHDVSVTEYILSETCTYHLI